MALLRICERAGLGDGANAELSFEHTDTYPITISDPFAEADEQRLEWYFEDWLIMPFTNTVEAQAVAASTVRYGETLFQQVFTDRRAYSRYKPLDLNTLRIEIAGSPEFHRLHWEALKDPELAQPLALRATLVRKNLRPRPLSAAGQVAPTINVLVVTARPELERDVGYRTISRPLVESLRQTQLPVQVDLLRPGTFAALLQHLEEMTDRHGSGYYHIMHFDVHGALLSYADLQAGIESNRLLYQARYGRADIPPYDGVKGFLFLEGGYVAQKQRRWGQAEDYYQNALAICIEFNDRYRQASTYHNLGYVAQEQQRWAQAEDYCQKALAICIEFNDRYIQAATYHQLGTVAQKQRRWGQSEDYYQKALAICIEFNDRYRQAVTYNNLGAVAEEQRRWAQALDYYLKALPVLMEFNDEFSSDVVLRNLARLRQAGQDLNLPAAVGAVLNVPVEQVEEMLGKLNQG